MVDHEFGGDWTELKLKALGSYLQQYRLIFTQNERAKYFKTIYIDAFAGTGERKIKKIESQTKSMFDDDSKDLERYRKGSARIALELESPFDQYIFVDKNKAHICMVRLWRIKNGQPTPIQFGCAKLGSLNLHGSEAHPDSSTSNNSCLL